MKAYAECDKQKKTPLLIDMTDPEKQAQFSPLETFFGYDAGFVELKKMVVEVNMKKTTTLDDARDEARAKLVTAIKRGLHFVFLLSNSAPPLQ